MTKWGWPKSRLTGPAPAPAATPRPAVVRRRGAARSNAWPGPGHARIAGPTRRDLPGPGRAAERSSPARRQPSRSSCLEYPRSRFGLCLGRDFPQDAVYELAGIRTAEGLGQLDRLVDRRFQRNARQEPDLVGGNPEQGALDLGHLVEAPVL